MADISKIVVPNGTQYNIKDSSARTDIQALENKADIYYVRGGSNDTTGHWTGTIPDITEYFDGLTVIFVPTVAGASTTYLDINGYGEVVCYYTNTTKLTTHFTVGTPIMLTYVAGSSSYWKRADYSVDKYINLYTQSSGTAYDADFPLLVSRTNYATIAAVGNGKATAVYAVAWNTDAPTVNPSTGLMKVKGLTVTDTITGNISGNAATVNSHSVGSDVPAVDTSDAGKFLTVNNQGKIVATTMTVWQGGNY